MQRIKNDQIFLKLGIWFPTGGLHHSFKVTFQEDLYNGVSFMTIYKWQGVDFSSDFFAVYLRGC